MPKRVLSTNPEAVKRRKQAKLKRHFIKKHGAIAKTDIASNDGILLPWSEYKLWKSDPAKYELRGVDYVKRGREMGTKNKSQRATNDTYINSINFLSKGKAKTSGKTRKQLQAMQSYWVRKSSRVVNTNI